MRDQRFIAVHRGGPLELAQHRQLAVWAAACAEHVLHFFESENPLDQRPKVAIETTRLWADGKATVGDAQRASVSAHGAARAAQEGAARFAARAAGQAVATAHMADHSQGAAWYGLKAVFSASQNLALMETEQSWQLEQMPEDLRSFFPVEILEKLFVR